MAFPTGLDDQELMGEAEGRVDNIHTASPRPTMLVGGHQLCVQAEVGSLQTLSAIREPLRRAQGETE